MGGGGGVVLIRAAGLEIKKNKRGEGGGGEALIRDLKVNLIYYGFELRKYFQSSRKYVKIFA